MCINWKLCPYYEIDQISCFIVKGQEIQKGLQCKIIGHCLVCIPIIITRQLMELTLYYQSNLSLACSNFLMLSVIDVHTDRIVFNVA